MKTLVITACLLFAGCKANVGVSGVELPRDSANTCSKQCRVIGLTLDSVVVMADNVGCVCRATDTEPATSSAAGHAGGGMAAVMLRAQAARAAQQQQQQRHSPSQPSPSR